MKKIAGNILTMLFVVAFLNFSYAQKDTLTTYLTVSKNGDGDFTTIQAAINAVRDLSRQKVTIFIRNGVYDEKLVIPAWKTNITLKGESKEKTIITHNDYSGKFYPDSTKDGQALRKFGTFNSYTVLVQANDFCAEDLTIENTAGRVGQAVALDVAATRCCIVNCTLSGYQDTLLTNNDSSL